MPPTRRSFLKALPAVIAAPAVAPAAPTPRPPQKWPGNTVHIPGADCDHCDCGPCVRERYALHGRPDHAAGVVALYRTRDALLTLYVAHGRHDRAECETCRDAFLMANALVWLESCLDGAFIPAGGPGAAVERQKKESRRLRDDLRAGRVPPLQAPHPGNDPGVEQAVLALCDARDALGEVADNHPEDGVAVDAEVGEYLCGIFADLLECGMIPTEATLARN